MSTHPVLLITLSEVRHQSPIHRTDHIHSSWRLPGCFITNQSKMHISLYNIPNIFTEEKIDHRWQMVALLYMYFTSNFYMLELVNQKKLSCCNIWFLFNYNKQSKHRLILAEHCMPHLHELVTLDANHMKIAARILLKTHTI